MVLQVSRLGQRGEGVAEGPGGTVYLPDALPGEHVRAELDGERGRVIDIVRASPDRVAPVCPYFGTCGGCAIQSLALTPYAEWKRGLLVTALSMARVETAVEPLVAAHGAGRRRVTFHARVWGGVNVLAEPAPVVGFMRARSHDIVDIAFCPILAPGLAAAVPAARAIAAALAPTGKPLDILVTATPAGLDIDVRGCGPLDGAATKRLLMAAAGSDCARVSNHGEVAIEARAPLLTMGKASLHLPPGCFLQATAEGEEALARAVLAGIGDARRVLDLFSGVGTFALRLAERATVHAVDFETRSLVALARAASSASLRPVTTEARDLFRRPYGVSDLSGYDAVVFDPPRAGALAQAEQLAASSVPVVVAVSCSPATFARDAAALLSGGYLVERIVPVDQFLYSAHLEVVAVFRRREKSRKRRSLLS